MMNSTAGLELRSIGLVYLVQFTLKSSMPTPSIPGDAIVASLRRLTGLQRFPDAQCTDVETVTPV